MRRRLRGALGALLSAATLTAGCSSSDEGASDTSDEAPASAPSTSVAATTAAPSTSATATTDAPTPTDAPSTSVVATTTTVAPSTSVSATTAPSTVTDGLDPPCVESTDPAAVIEPGPAFETFGPLGAEPALVIDLPAARRPGMDFDLPVAVAGPIDGGVLVAVGPPSNASIPTFLLAAVGLDGRVRWVRCLSETVWEIYSAPGAAAALVRTRTPGSPTGTWQEVALATGIIGPAPLFDSGGEWSDIPLAHGGDMVLFGPPDDALMIGAGDRLLLYDFGSGGSTEFAFPDVALGKPAFRLQFAFGATGQLVLMGEPPRPAVLSVFDGEVWTDGPADLDEPLPIRTVFQFLDDAPTLVGFDADGEIVWTNANVLPFSGEGSVSESVGDVTIVAGCWGPTPAESVMCDRHEVGAIDSATGEVLWQLSGNRNIGPVGDGYALITDGPNPGGTVPGGWVMVDARTGEIVDETQRWSDPVLFASGCCGDEFNWVDRHGGVVIATHDRRTTVWYPASAGLEPHSVSLP